jgi:NADPH2:quinone reductase
MAGRTPPTPVNPGQLMSHSTAVIGFWLVHIVQRPAVYAQTIIDLLALLAKGELRAIVGGTYSLDQAADAHRALLDRSSVGKLVLTP